MSLIRRAVTKFALRTLKFWESLGIHILLVDYYSPIPETKNLPDELFEKKSECIGIDWNYALQSKYLKEVFPRYASETNFEKNPGISLVDAAILHAMIRRYKPKKIIETGSGQTTKIMARSCLMNMEEGHSCEYIAIDPEPREYVKKGLPGFTRLIESRVELVGLEVFRDCDLLFIDSTHVVKIGADVNYEILEIIPRLKEGALVHFHDILLPGEYWKEWVIKAHYFFTEQYLLHAFLLFNKEFEIVWASRYMHLKEPQEIKAVFPYFEPDKHHITSFWIRRNG